MTSLSCGVEALLRAAQFLEEQELDRYQPIVLKSPQLSTGKRQSFSLYVSRSLAMASSSENLSQIDDFLGMEVETVTLRLSRTKHPRNYTPARGLRVCVHGKVTLQSPSPFFGVFSFFLSQPPAGSFESFSQSQTTPPFVCCMEIARIMLIWLFVSSASSSPPPPPLAFPCKTQTKVSGLNLFFVLHFHPFSFGLFQNAAFVGKSLFVPGFFFPSLELSAAV